MIAYFHVLDKWDNIVSVTHEAHGTTLVYQRLTGKEFGEPIKVRGGAGFNAFYASYRMILAEDIAEERQRLLDLIGKSAPYWMGCGIGKEEFPPPRLLNRLDIDKAPGFLKSGEVMGWLAASMLGREAKHRLRQEILDRYPEEKP